MYKNIATYKTKNEYTVLSGEREAAASARAAIVGQEPTTYNYGTLTIYTLFLYTYLSKTL